MKSRTRNSKDFFRKTATRSSYERILIICEGSKTEPNYFNEIRKEFNLSSTSIKILPSDYGTSPKQIVQYAYDLFVKGDLRRGIKKAIFDKIFVVFDRDQHESYEEALRLSQQYNSLELRNDEKAIIEFNAIVSVPCFEIWLLLHFILINNQLDRDLVLKKLLKHFPQYTKAGTNSFFQTKDRLTTAMLNSSKLKRTFSRDNGLDPYTDVGELVQLLMNLKK